MFLFPRDVTLLFIYHTYFYITVLWQSKNKGIWWLWWSHEAKINIFRLQNFKAWYDKALIGMDISMLKYSVYCKYFIFAWICIRCSFHCSFVILFKKDWSHFVPFITWTVLSFVFIMQIHISFFYRTDEVTFSRISFFLWDESEFFLRGNVPLKVISGHPLLRSNSTSSDAPAVLACETQVRPSWSIALTLAFD